ncbi:NAD-dependent epimerase/dehydratase family protein, partial [Klebsiella aerogenes]|uniref:NAD-dependent epimerase/dehydratase family protein n=1 Tax=Klebsiella aerogenes TaxID=548 RepID=UPI0034D717C1
VAEAYLAAMTRAENIAPGTVLNISSGKPVRIRVLLDMLVAQTKTPIRIEIDPARWRENDIPTLVGDSSLARQMLGWLPRYELSQTMADILE